MGLFYRSGVHTWLIHLVGVSNAVNLSFSLFIIITLDQNQNQNQNIEVENDILMQEDFLVTSVMQPTSHMESSLSYLQGSDFTATSAEQWWTNLNRDSI